MVSTAVADARPPRRRKGYFQRRGAAFWLMVPAIAILLAITIYPLVYALRISFYELDPKIKGLPFVGGLNYVRVVEDPHFYGSLLYTTFVVAVAVGIEFFFGLGLAVLLAGKFRGRRFFLSVLMLPVMIAPIVVGLTFRLMWDNRYGVINQIIGWFAGGDVNISWLNKTNPATFAILLTEIWQWTPFMFLILLAGLSAVSREIQEAAEIDGASPWKAFWYVTLPVLKPVIIVALLIRILDAIKLFDIIVALTKGGPLYTTETISYFIFRAGLQFFRISYGAAASFILLTIVVVITIIFFKQTRFAETVGEIER